MSSLYEGLMNGCSQAECCCLAQLPGGSAYSLLHGIINPIPGGYMNIPIPGGGAIWPPPVSSVFLITNAPKLAEVLRETSSSIPESLKPPRPR